MTDETERSQKKQEKLFDEFDRTKMND